MPKRIASAQMYVSALFALFGAMTMGSVLIWSGSALESLKKSGSVPRIRVCSNCSTVIILEEDAPYETYILNSMSLGAMAGSLFAGIPNLIGWACICYARNFNLIIIGRFVVGFGVGINCNASPVYLIDIATPTTRGFFGAAFHIMLCFGLFYEVCFESILEWNHLSYTLVVPGLISSFGMLLFGTESPRRLVQSGDCAEARSILNKIRHRKSDIDDELIELEKCILSRKHRNVLSPANLKRRVVYQPALISVFLMAFQQISGINTLLFYLKDIFEEIDLSPNLNSNTEAIILSGALVLATAHSAIAMNKLGRKMLLIISGIGQVVALALIGLYYKTIQPNNSWLPLACLFMFVVMYSFGFGPIPWLLPGEMTPRPEIPMVSCSVSLTNWTFVFLITKYSAALTNELRKSGIYWLYAGCSALSVLFTIFFVPETNV